ncbi:MAG: PAS domain S-box protein [Prolixibacteraceae bacterium]|nr:PAS domain S-box protein [Prolixibacteraceae bacterium]
MDQTYRILLVEDELYDAELNIREVKKILPNSLFERVDSKNAFIIMIETYFPDIIISDYNMPSFDGLSALKIAREICPETPFIVVTGSINEDTAVECMKAGATDYVLKDSLKRLGSSVLNALEQSKIRKERIDAIETIKLNEAKYRHMFHNNPQPMWIYDVKTLAFLEVNKAAVKHYGFSQDEFLSMRLIDILPQSEADRLMKNIESTDYLEDKAEEWTHKKKTGELVSVEIVSYFIIFNQRNARHVLINDITEKKEAEERMINGRKLLRTLIDNLPVTIYVKDAECRKIIANRADLNVLGAETEAEVLGKTDLEIFSNDIGTRGYADDKKIIETGIPVLNQEEYFYDSNGIQHWLLTSKIPLTDENGKITGLVGIGHSITEQRKMQAELIEAKEKAEESDRLKSAFLANMSHEIRTPLNSIIGFSELLDDPDFDAEQKTEFIKHIVDNGNSLLMIISDIMDFSMLEAGQLKLRQQSISVKKIMNELLTEFGHKAEVRGIQLRFDDSQNDPDILITSDSYRIKQVFNNLIGNALKFTSEGFVEIGYKVKDEKIEFHVKDSGIGISPKFHQAIFERFRQVDTTKSRKYGGNGLGLAISKNLVQLLGGKIWLESEPDEYSDFFFTIPISNL